MVQQTKSLLDIYHIYIHIVVSYGQILLHVFQVQPERPYGGICGFVHLWTCRQSSILLYDLLCNHWKLRLFYGGKTNKCLSCLVTGSEILALRRILNSILRCTEAIFCMRARAGCEVVESRLLEQTHAMRSKGQHHR